jgi:tetratricopeptide (TPR) repeat protein
MAEVWFGARKQQIEAAFVATGTPYAKDAFASAARVIDDYVQHWKTMYVDACMATRVRGEQSEELLDLRMSCLEQRRDELKALTELFATADAKMVEKAAQAAYSLADVDQCANIAALRAPIPPPRDRAARAQVEAVRKRLAQASALAEAGKLPESLRAAAAVVAEARALEYSPMTAEAWLLEGKIEQRSDDGSNSESSLRQALIAAADGHHERVAFEAAWRLAYSVGYLLRRPEEGRFWGDFALAIIRRLSEHSDEEVPAVFNVLSTIASEEGKSSEALALIQRAIGLTEKSNAESPQLAMYLHNMSVVLAQLDRHADALVAARRAKDICEKTKGPNHPEMAMMLHMTGLSLMELKRYNEALPLMRQVLAIDERTFGPLHYRTGLAYGVVGEVYEHLGDLEQALANNRRAIAIYEKGAITIRLTMAAYLNIGRIELKRGHPIAAVAPLERALAIEQSAGKGGPASDLAQVRFTLAQALWDTHSDRQRAVTLAREARAVYATEPRFNQDLAETDAWLAAHRY